MVVADMSIFSGFPGRCTATCAVNCTALCEHSQRSTLLSMTYCLWHLAAVTHVAALDNRNLPANTRQHMCQGLRPFPTSPTVHQDFELLALGLKVFQHNACYVLGNEGCSKPLSFMLPSACQQAESTHDAIAIARCSWHRDPPQG